MDELTDDVRDQRAEAESSQLRWDVWRQEDVKRSLLRQIDAVTLELDILELACTICGADAEHSESINDPPPSLGAAEIRSCCEEHGLVHVLSKVPGSWKQRLQTVWSALRDAYASGDSERDRGSLIRESLLVALRLRALGVVIRPKTIGFRYAAIGDIYMAQKWYFSGDTASHDRMALLVAETQLLEGRWQPDMTVAADKLVRSRAKTVLAVLHNSLPWSQSGYATRSHGLLRGIRGNGWGITAVTRPGFPSEDVGFQSCDPVLQEDVVEDIRYRRLPSGGYAYNQCPITAYISNYAEVLEEEIRQNRPAIVHAASNYVSGIAAVIAARRTGVPVIYEIRGLWDLTRSSRQPDWGGSDQQRLQRLMEIRAARSADFVITITDGLKDELIKSGVSSHRISVIPNGVDTNRFAPRAADEDLRATLGLQDRVVIGYIGSIVNYEGLVDLANAAAVLRTRYGDLFHVLVVGDGKSRKELEAAIEDLGVGSHFTLTGSVPHADVERYYSIIDICPFPRKSIPVCEIVSPLKPFEAMAMGKSVIVSSVKPLAEIVIHDKTGMIFPAGDYAALADRLGQLIEDREMRKDLGENAQAWVAKHRDWSVLSQLVLLSYQNAAALAAGKGGSPAHNEEPFDQSASDVHEALSTIRERLQLFEHTTTPREDEEQTLMKNVIRQDRDALATALEAETARTLAAQLTLQDVEKKLVASQRETEKLDSKLRDSSLEVAYLNRQEKDLKVEIDRLLKSSGAAFGRLVQFSSTSLWQRALWPFRMARFATSATYRSKWKVWKYASMDAGVKEAGKRGGPRMASSLIWHRWRIGRVETVEALRLGYSHLKDGDRYKLSDQETRQVSMAGLEHGRLLLRMKWNESLRHQLEWRYRKLGMSKEADACKKLKGIGSSQPKKNKPTETEILALRSLITTLPGDADDVTTERLDSTPTTTLSPDVILDRCLTFGTDACEQWVRGILGSSDEGKIWSTMWKGLKDCHQHGAEAECLVRDAIKYAERISVHPRYLHWRHLRVGDLLKSLESLQHVPVWERSKKVRWDDYIAKARLFQEGWPFPEMGPPHDDTSDRTIYLLHNTLPWSSSGYASRSHGILRSLRASGVDAVGLSRLGFPWDRFTSETPDVAMEEEVDGVPYHRMLREEAMYGEVPLDRYLGAFEQSVSEAINQQNPRLIHAASNFMNGIAGGSAARAHGLPYIYEVRGLWELTRASRQPSWSGSEEYMFMANMERDAAIHANVVITLTGGLRDEMIRRGVDRDKIVLVPNGVDSTRFVPREPDEALREELGIGDRTIIGYVGSTVPYEGLDDLINAVAALRDIHGDTFRLLMIGDGTSLPGLKKQAEDLGLDECILFTGRVPHADVERYYSLIDICPFPRKPQPVCELVSPLKPFESMAMCKAVVASNVQALSEIVQDGVTGLLFEKGSTTALVEALDRLITDDHLRTDLGLAAREWVVAERDWHKLGQLVADVYERIAPCSAKSANHA